MSEHDEETDPLGRPPPSAPMSHAEEMRLVFANVLAEQLEVPNAKLDHLRHGLATLTDKVHEHDRRLIAVEALRLYVPILAILVAGVALVVALVALLHGGA